MTIDPREFRNVLGHFATGVTIVTTANEGKVAGFTANAFCSVSLDPPLVLVCITNTSSALALIEASRIFSVNILAADQEDLARCFAKSGPEKNERFCTPDHHTQTTGAPIFDHALAWVDCRLHAIYPGGDHIIAVGEVVALGMHESDPLLFVNGRYATLPLLKHVEQG